MKALEALNREIVALYACHVEIEIALRRWTDTLNRDIIRGSTTPDNFVSFSRGDTDSFDPNSPKASFQYRKTLRDTVRDSEENGINVRLNRNSVVVFICALWEEEYREQIAKECGLKTKDSINSDVFRDINKYRQAVLHANGRLDRNPQVIPFFKKGEVVALTKNQMYDLFDTVINELNRIGETYYCQNPAFSLCNRLNSHQPQC